MKIVVVLDKLTLKLHILHLELSLSATILYFTEIKKTIRISLEILWYCGKLFILLTFKHLVIIFLKNELEFKQVHETIYKINIITKRN